ncbi:MAG: OsmC family peroxiredoxin [Deltaproteobacteria bacterium]|nr:OsmC family peroxiredoxin [Deltaproteobacteria bacterium]
MRSVFVLILVLVLCTGAAADPYAIEVVVEEESGRVVSGSVRGHRLSVDQPTEWGGGNTAPTPPETLAFAVGACVVSTARLVAMLEMIDVGRISVTVRGSVDFSKAMGQATDQRAGFKGLEIVIDLDGPLNREDKEAFVARVNERCPLCDTTANQTPFSLTLARL